MSYSLFMNLCKHDEHSTELASLDAQTADAPDPNRTAHHPVHLPRALYFEARGSTFLTFPPCRIAARVADGATHGRPVPTPWLVSSSFSSDATL